jgi:hypothetical protein
MEMNMQPAMPQAAPEEAGRGTDTVMAHLSLGEVVIPREFLENPQVMQALQMIFQDGGADMAEFTVGDPANKINPETGYPEFFKFKKFFKSVAPIALPIALAALGPAAFGGAGLFASLGGAGALGTGLAASTSSALGGALGGGLGGAIGGGGVKGVVKGAALGGAGGYLAGGGASELLGGTQLGNTLGLANPDGGSLIGNAIGSSGAGGSAANGTGLFSNLLSGNTFGTTAGSALPNGVGATQGTGILGSVGRTTASLGDAFGGLTGGSSSGGGSSFGNIGAMGSLASALGGSGQDRAIKKQEDQLLGAQNQQLSNLENLNPVDVQNDPGYQFNLQQGQQGLDRKAAASGGLFSGAALKDASQYNQDFANNYYQQAYGRQANLVGAQNDIYGNTGNINANATMGRSNNLNQTLANAFGANVGSSMGANNMSTAELLALLKQRGVA